MRNHLRYGFGAAAVFAVLFMACAAGSAALAADCADVQTAYGKVTGKALGKAGLCEFRGIPFAAPPVGELRFAMPQPPEPWEGSRETVKFSAECVQYPLLSLISGNGQVIGGEDCLYLNVWGPNPPAAEKKPVMVFIHGGAFITGSANTSLYEGENLASRGGVVVVTVNYRLGVFGFYSHPGLGEGRGNFGIHDQVAALKWVKENIANFGGNPEDVTIFGESAGGMSVGLHVLSPVSAGLYHRAIIESGPMTYLGRTLEEADAEGVELAGVAGCAEAEKQLECMRGLDAAALHEIAKPSMAIGKGSSHGPGGEEEKSFSFGPAIDGKLLPDHPMKMLAEGRYNKNVEQIIVGSNKDEMSYFTLSRKLDTPEEFETQLKKDSEEIMKTYGIEGDPEKMMALYPLADYPSPRKAYNALAGDMAFGCSSLAVAKLLSAAGADVYLYNFAKAPDEKGLAKDWGAFHGAELPFIFGQFEFFGFKFKTRENVDTAKSVMGLWSSFAHTGVPSAEGVPEWPKFNPETGPYMRLDLVSEVKENFKPDQCGYFESLMKSSMK